MVFLINCKITDNILNVAELFIFERQKNYPDKLEESKRLIELMKIDIKKGDKFPAIIIQVDNNGDFMTIVDGRHRIISHRQLKIMEIFAIYVNKL